MTVREHIAATLKARNWTQADLAEAIRVPRSNLCESLSGRRSLQVQHLLLIDLVLHLDLDYGALQVEKQQ